MPMVRCRYGLVSALVILAAHLFVGAVTVTAIPLADYHRKLKDAITSLDTLNEIDEDAGKTELRTRVTFITVSVKLSLPEHQTVEAGSEVFTIDNAWLHKDLDELTRTPDAEVPGKISYITATLHAIEERVAERQNAASAGESKDQAKRRLENILARPEYATTPRSSNALAELIQKFFRWLQKFLPKRRVVDPGRVDLITTIAQFIIVGLAALLMIYVFNHLMRFFMRRQRKVKTRKKREPRIVLGERLRPEATATDLLSEAEALARQGDLRAAIRKAYIALLLELGDRKVISLAQHKTNRDYLNSLRGIPRLHSRMRGLTDSFEHHWYGFADATANDWQDFRTGYLAALRSETN